MLAPRFFEYLLDARMGAAAALVSTVVDKLSLWCTFESEFGGIRIEVNPTGLGL